MLASGEVLVTGGAGYIGSHTCKALKTAGYKPVVIDNLSTGYRHNVKWGKLHEADLRNTSALNDIFTKHKFVGIIHFAASAYVGISVQNPLSYYDNNINSTVKLLETANKFGVNKFVFSSSCATYGEPDTEQISEVTPQKPINPYGHTKLVCENLLRSLSQIDLINYVALRYFNAAGADSDIEIGEEHEPETHILPLLIKAAINNGDFTIFGNDYLTDDGTCIRDYINVADLASAHVSALDYLLKGQTSVELNLGSGIGISNLQLANGILDLGYKFKINFGPRRSGDPARLVANNDLAKKVLGWEPKNSDLENIIKSALSWHLKN